MNPDAVYIRGLCFYFQGSLVESINQFIFDQNRTSAKLYLIKARNLKAKKELGNMFFNEGNYRKAFFVYAEALQIDQNNKAINSQLYFNRALACSMLGNNHSAIADCTLTLQYNSKHVKALRLRARCYFAIECFDGCIRDYKAALEIEKSREIENLLRFAQTKLERSKRKNYYKILGIENKATFEDIKKAYRKLALAYHPDKNYNSTVDEKRKLENMFKEVGEAFGILSDVTKRQQYDKTNEIHISFSYRTKT